jgi:hypothetical protein
MMDRLLLEASAAGAGAGALSRTIETTESKK